MAENLIDFPRHDGTLLPENRLTTQVDVRLKDGREFRCTLDLSEGETLREYMNRREEFVAIRTLAGEEHLLGKDAIEEIYEVSAPLPSDSCA